MRKDQIDIIAMPKVTPKGNAVEMGFWSGTNAVTSREYVLGNSRIRSGTSLI